MSNYYIRASKFYIQTPHIDTKESARWDILVYFTRRELEKKVDRKITILFRCGVRLSTATLFLSFRRTIYDNDYIKSNAVVLYMYVLKLLTICFASKM